MGRSLWPSALVILVVVGGCARSMRPASQHLVEPQAAQAAASYVYWQAQLPLRPSDRVKKCHLVDDNLYVLTNLGDVFVLHADQGLIRWHAELTRRDFKIHRPSHLWTPTDDGPVVFVASGGVRVFDRYSGDEKLAAKLPFPVGSGAVGDATRLYMGSTDGHMYSLLWCHPFGADPLQRWAVATGGPVTVAPVLREGSLFFATERGAIASSDPLSNEKNWIFRTQGTISAELVVDDYSVYAASEDRSLYRVDRTTGRLLWQHRFPKPLTTSPAVADFVVYQHCSSMGLVALDVDSGERKWVREDATEFLSAMAGEAAILTTGLTVDIVDTQTGHTKRWFPLEGATIAAANLESDAVYVASPDGRVACIRAKSVPYLRQQEVYAARAYLNRPPRSQTDDAGAARPAATKSAPDPFRSERDGQ